MSEPAAKQRLVPNAGLWPEGGLEAVSSCPICGSTTRELLHGDLRDRVFFCAPGTWTLYRCKKCGSGYLDPRPTPETIGLAYSRYFTHAANGRKPYDNLGIVGRLRRTLANGYRNTRYHTNLTPSRDKLGFWVAQLLPGDRATLEAEARHLARPLSGARLLDVGCGNGAFLELARAMGWDVTGLEPDPKAVEICRRRGHSVVQGDIGSLASSSERYDVITMSHVIEHVHGPRRLLEGCFRLLKPGGRIWIETPNLTSAGHLRYGRDWRGLEPPRHLVLFTWESIRLMLMSVGFAEITTLPARPVARGIFPASEAIARRLDPYAFADGSLLTRLRALRADHKGRRVCESREFITVGAAKPKRTAARGCYHERRQC